MNEITDEDDYYLYFKLLNGSEPYTQLLCKIVKIEYNEEHNTSYVHWENISGKLYAHDSEYDNGYWGQNFDIKNIHEYMKKISIYEYLALRL